MILFKGELLCITQSNITEKCLNYNLDKRNIIDEIFVKWIQDTISSGFTK